jgi:hypothetical protein
MAIIYSYPTTPPLGTDLLIGTRTSSAKNPTRNFSVNQLANYIIDNIGGTTLTVPIFFDVVNPLTGVIQTTLVDSIMTQDVNPNGTTLTIAGNISITGTIADSTGATGAANQVLTSTVTGTAWALVQGSTEIIPFNNVAVVTANHTGLLGTFPSVTVVNPNNIVIFGEIKYITTTQLTITFTSAQTGNVYLN